MKAKATAILLLAMSALACGCSQAKWKVEGTLASATGNEQIIVEAPDNQGGWRGIDTVSVDRSGRFTVKGLPLGRPEILRLNLDGQSIYFPIDSIETISVEADAKAFDSQFTLSGSDSAEKMNHINALIAAVAAEQGEQAVAFDPDLKRQLTEAILRDPAGLVAYYIIFRRVGNTLIFNPQERSDLRVIGAVANAFHQQRPDDPRTRYLAQVFMGHRRQAGLSIPGDTIAAVEISLPPLALRNEMGQLTDIEAVASKGNVVLLSFLAYAAPNSPAVNLELRNLYDRFHANGLEIYQVGLDEDEYTWRDSAVNLPWITVYNSENDGNRALLNYNVTTIPAFFIINRHGELVERIEGVAELAGAVQRYL